MSPDMVIEPVFIETVALQVDRVLNPGGAGGEEPYIVSRNRVMFDLRRVTHIEYTPPNDDIRTSAKVFICVNLDSGEHLWFGRYAGQRIIREWTTLGEWV